MAEHETGRNRDEAIVRVDVETEVTLPDRVRGDMRTLQWLYHRVVDLMASHGHAGLMIQDVENRLEVLGSDMVEDAVNDLVREAYAAVRDPWVQA